MGVNILLTIMGDILLLVSIGNAISITYGFSMTITILWLVFDYVYENCINLWCDLKTVLPFLHRDGPLTIYVYVQFGFCSIHSLPSGKHT